MSGEKTLVECQDCGYRWESSADAPRCAQSDCGRSRNVEPVAEIDESTEQSDEDGEESTDVDDETHTPRESDDGQQTAQSDEQADYEPAFESTTVRKDASRSRASTEQSDDRDDEQDVDEQADADEESETKTPSGEGDLPTLDADQLEPALDATFDMLAERRGEHWELDGDIDGEGEAAKLAEAWTPVINNYAPYILRQYTEIGAAVIITYTVIGPRLAKDKKLAEQEEQADVDEESSGTVREQRREPADDVVEESEAIEDGQATVEAEAGESPGGYASV